MSIFSPPLFLRQQDPDPPPPYSAVERFDPDGLPRTSTELLSDDDKRVRRIEYALRSMPGYQFEYQRKVERERIIDQLDRKLQRRKRTLPFDEKLDFDMNAENNVINRWKDQGIWNDTWTLDTGGFGSCWKHEEPAGQQSDTESTRPYAQFVYQVSKEREWLQDEIAVEPEDVDAKAHDNIKNRWIEQEIWNRNWEDMPGKAWMHEELDESDNEFYDDFLGGPRTRAFLAAVENDETNRERESQSPNSGPNEESPETSDTPLQTTPKGSARRSRRKTRRRQDSSDQGASKSSPLKVDKNRRKSPGSTEKSRQHTAPDKAVPNEKEQSVARKSHENDAEASPAVFRSPIRRSARIKERTSPSHASTLNSKSSPPAQRRHPRKERKHRNKFQSIDI